MTEQHSEKWDAVVIGSGLGGLSCAAYLCAAGKRTLVLEAHYVAGGSSQMFRREIHGRHYEFDVGVHYIGECGREGSITRVLRGVGLGERVTFRPLDPDCYTTLLFPDFTFRVPVGWERYRARLLETFPAEAEALGKVVDIFREVAQALSRMNDGEVSAPELFVQAPTFAQWAMRPVTELFREYGLSQRVQAVLLGEQGAHAVRPSKTAVALAAGITHHFTHGAFYPQGGGQVIAARLVEAIRAYGGAVRTHAPVARVRMAQRRVAGVELRDGTVIEAPIVVSNADLKRTVQQLVGEEHFAADTVERVRAFRMALPIFMVYLGVKIDPATLDLPNSSFGVCDTYDVEGLYEQLENGQFPEKGSFGVIVTSIKDPTNRRLAPEGCSNVQVMTIVPRDYSLWHVGEGEAENWAYRRDPEYKRRKDALADRLIAGAERVIPGLRERIDWREAATPPTLERFAHSTGGTSYGIELSLEQMGPVRLGPHTEVPGLYLCGASTPSGHGIGGVLSGGVAAASAILERDLYRDVVKGAVFGDPDRLPPVRDDWDPWRESH